MVQVLIGIPSMRSSEKDEILQHDAPRFARPQTLWGQMAARQLKLRCKTEEENDMLKDLMSSQRRTVRNIKRMIRRRADGELMEDLCNSKRPKMKNIEQVLRELLFGIDKIYVNLDRFYAEKGMNSVPCPGRERRVYPAASNGSPFVEFSDKNLVPFSFDRAENAIWNFLRGPRSRGQVHVRSKECQHATETATCCVDITCTGRGLSTHVSEQRVARKFTQENSTVFISRTRVVPTVEKYFSSMRFNETLRIIVRCGIPLFAGQVTTIIESHYSVSRDTKDCEPSIERQWNSYLNLAVKGWERKVSFNTQEIENLLFKECIETRDLEIS
ncbi:hypothetical protein PHMEG_00038078 [Phytophthora megakarya]|uniref:Uncharacterized protein n=1 Tax=Phytophthora megakarya TaxID=4795 RepID=A0A225UIF9_9STRA|nr:hypothetical protein PHMEG_00038078 [Phytophthora megakarya]